MRKITSIDLWIKRLDTPTQITFMTNRFIKIISSMKDEKLTPVLHVQLICIKKSKLKTTQFTQIDPKTKLFETKTS